MEFELARYWWVVALRGVLAILFGVLIFFAPGLGVLFMVASFAAYALVDGVLAITAAVRGRGRDAPWWALLLEGIAGIGAAVVAIAWPGITALALLYVVAGWSIATGILEIAAAIRLRKYIEGEWLLALSGVLSILLGLVLGLMPVPGLLALALWIGAYAVVSGVLLLVLAFRLRGMARHVARSEYASAR